MPLITLEHFSKKSYLPNTSKPRDVIGRKSGQYSNINQCAIVESRQLSGGRSDTNVRKRALARAIIRHILLSLLLCQCANVEASCSDERSHHSRKHSNPPIDLTVVGGVCNADGIGRQTTDLMEMLNNSTTMSFVPERVLDQNELQMLSPSLLHILNTSGITAPGRVLILESSISYPPSNEIPNKGYWTNFGLPEKAATQIRFAYTMFESSQLPKSWVYILNTSFDAAIVPDRFLIDVYRNSGVTIPVFVIPLGRDFSCFLNAPIKQSKQSPFVFANFGGCFFRKNLTTLVRAFGDAFGNSPAVRLRLGWRVSDEKARQEVLSEIKTRGLTNVLVDEGVASPDYYLSRFLGVDCYVSPSIGEGFSIQPREAMALGIPVIVTNNTGQTTICSSGLVKSVPSSITIPAVYHFPGQYGVQYQCHIRDVAMALRHVYDHYDTYLCKAPQARAWARRYHFTNMAPLYRALISPKKVFLGSKDKIFQDGRVMTTSKKLIRKYQRIFQKAKK